MYLPGLEASLHAGARAGQLDHVSVDPRTDAIGYTAGASGTRLDGTLLSAPTAATSHQARALAGGLAVDARRGLSERIVQFSTSLDRGGGDVIDFRHAGALTVIHRGAPGAISLTLSSFAADGHPIAVALGPVRLAAGATLRVAPQSWQRLGRAPILVALSGGGHPGTRRVLGRLLGRRFASVARASLVSLGRGRRALRVRLRLAHPPAGAWLSIAAAVLRGGHPVATSLPAQLSGAALRSRTVTLALSRSPAPGRYRLRVRLLESTARGAVQSSVIVARTFAAGI